MYEDEIELIDIAYAEIDQATAESAVSKLIERVVDKINKAHEAGISYEAIAKKAGVSEKYLRRFKNLEYLNPSFDVIVGLKSALEFESFDDMFSD